MTDLNLTHLEAHTVNLASPRLGSEVVFASDDFFADKSRLIKDAAPVFYPDKYDEHGKWMDGWESRRQRDGSEDFCIIRLGCAGVIRAVNIDTAHFTGNFPPAASLSACLSDGVPDENTPWTEIVPKTTLGPDRDHLVAVVHETPYNWMRLNMFPDGGIARLRLYGQPFKNWGEADRNVLHELSALTGGARIVGYNDAHYGNPWPLLIEGRGMNMGDGWETRRRREPGFDWIIIALGYAGTIEKIELDTAYFKGNYPHSFSLNAALVTGGDDPSIDQANAWDELLPKQILSADSQHFFNKDMLNPLGPISHIKLNIYPDGGVSRFRAFGKVFGS